jgi:hypothetical protein
VLDARSDHRRVAHWNLAVSAVSSLPLVPASHIGDTPIADIDPAERGTAIIFTRNYGEGGAIERYGPSRGLPPVYSAHNTHADFGIPAGSASTVVVIGYDDPREWSWDRRAAPPTKHSATWCSNYRTPTRNCTPSLRGSFTMWPPGVSARFHQELGVLAAVGAQAKRLRLRQQSVAIARPDRRW